MEVKQIATTLQIEEFQVRNLIRLAKYLYELPVDYSHFEMNTYNRDGDGYDVYTNNECGTAACAIGHTFYVKGLEGSNIKGTTGRGLYWGEISEYFYGEDDEGATFGEFCFSSLWSTIDNTPLGAAQRITCVLLCGKVTRVSSDYKKAYQDLTINDLPSIEE